MLALPLLQRQVLTADFKLPFRPGYGKDGRVIHLRTNHYTMTIDPNKLIYNYTVAIKAERKKRNEDAMGQEEPKAGRKQRQAFALLLEEPEFRNLHPGLATDYGNTILTSTPLKLRPTKSKVFNFIYRDVEDWVAPPDATRYSFTITEAVGARSLAVHRPDDQGATMSKKNPQLRTQDLPPTAASDA